MTLSRWIALLIFQEQGNMEPLNEHLANLKHPQSSMEPLNRREPDDYKSSVNTRFVMIHFPETCLHGHLELEQCAIWFLQKEPSHWTIHFPETRLLDIRNPSRMRSLHLHKPSALFPQCSLPHCSHAFILCSNDASIIIRRTRTPTLLLPWLRHDGSALDRVGCGHRWPHH